MRESRHKCCKCVGRLFGVWKIILVVNKGIGMLGTCLDPASIFGVFLPKTDSGSDISNVEAKVSNFLVQY